MKGYIFKNEDKRWELGFVLDIDEEGPALYTRYNDYPNWKAAFYALQKKQLGYK